MDMQDVIEAHNGLSLVLPQVLTIETIEAVFEEMSKLPLVAGTILNIESSGVENITTPGIQLILSLEKSLAAQGGRVCMLHPSEALQVTMNELGLGELLAKLSLPNQMNREGI